MGNISKNKPKKEIEALYKKIGTNKQIAELCNRAQSQVSNWLYQKNSYIPFECVEILEKTSGMKIPKKYITKSPASTKHPYYGPIIKKFGSIINLAKELDIATPQLSRIINDRHKPPARIVEKLCKLSDGKIRPHMLRPDIFSK